MRESKNKNRYEKREFRKPDRREQKRSQNRDYSSGKGKRRGDLEFFTVTCDKCGKECEVPFRPTAGKPVYCSECFEKKENSNSRRDHSGNSSGTLDEINRKLDKIMRALDIR